MADYNIIISLYDPVELVLVLSFLSLLFEKIILHLKRSLFLLLLLSLLLEEQPHHYVSSKVVWEQLRCLEVLPHDLFYLGQWQVEAEHVVLDLGQFGKHHLNYSLLLLFILLVNWLLSANKKELGSVALTSWLRPLAEASSSLSTTPSAHSSRTRYTARWPSPRSWDSSR